MGFASHLGPWLLGTNKYTTGTTAGSIQNMGATTVAQTGTMTVTTTTATTFAVIPAGAQITNIFCDITTAFSGTTGNTITIQTAAGTALATIGGATTTPLAVGRATTTLSGTNMATLLNVGSTDLVLQVIYACAGTASGGAAQITVQYIVKGSDGVMYPTSTQN